jgi:hypothetical protein
MQTAIGSTAFIGNARAFQASPQQARTARGNLQVSFRRFLPPWRAHTQPAPTPKVLLQVMAAGLKDMRDRITSVKNTKKITDAMKLVSFILWSGGPHASMSLTPGAPRGRPTHSLAALPCAPAAPRLAGW